MCTKLSPGSFDNSWAISCHEAEGLQEDAKHMKDSYRSFELHFASTMPICDCSHMWEDAFQNFFSKLTQKNALPTKKAIFFFPANWIEIAGRIFEFKFTILFL